MIRLSNGHCFEYMAASGALGFDGKGWFWERPLKWLGLFDPSLFTVVIKTLTISPIKEKTSVIRRVRIISNGVVNAIRLENPGIKWWCEKIGPTVDARKISLVASIFGEPDEIKKMAEILNDFDLVGVELNASCPSTDSDILQNTKKVIMECEILKKTSRHPVILKASVAHEIGKIIREVSDFIEAISINSVHWDIAYGSQRISPLEVFGGGGVSGKAAQPFTWALAEKLVNSTSIPIIGPSVWDFEDIAKLRQKIRVKAISFGSIFLRYPWRPTLFVKRDLKNSR